MDARRNVLCAFWSQVKERAGETAVVQKRPEGWVPMKWGELGERVARFASALRAAGLKPGERFAIYSDNCQEWMIADYASQCAGLISVPLYPNLTDEQLRYVLEHSEARAIFVRGEARLKKLQGIGTLAFARVITRDAAPSGGAIDFDELVKSGAPDPAPWIKHAETVDPESTATISYTSGTTAYPKGVILSHRNLSFQSNALESRSARVSSDVVLSYLPLSHITERLNQFRHAARGYTVCFGGGIETVAADLKEIRPTSFVAVPRIYEKFQEAIQARVKSPLLQRFLRRKIIQGLGLDRCTSFYSGAAPLDRSTADFFAKLGIHIHEGYGLTECAGASHLHLLNRPVRGTVGPALDGMECRIAEDGEILLKGGNVFMGYYRDEAATREAIRDGWLHTGDIGAIDARGCLRITDRKKNIIVTSAGKNVSPAPIEAELKKHPDISQAVVIGDKRKFLVALVTLAPGRTSAEAHAAVQAHVHDVNSRLASYETIKDFRILERDFSIESGELTPTLKVKRSVVQEKNQALLDAMYAAKSGTRESGVEIPVHP